MPHRRSIYSLDGGNLPMSNNKHPFMTLSHNGIVLLIILFFWMGTLEQCREFVDSLNVND